MVCIGESRPPRGRKSCRRVFKSNNNMFNLEEKITDWRQQMLAAGIKTPVPLEELEIHLREEIEQRTKSGQNDPTAFAAAVQKFGSGYTLRNEFQKIEPARGGRRQYLFLEIWFLASTLLIPLVAVSQAFFMKDGAFADMTLGQQTASLAAAFTFSLLAWGVRHGFEKLPRLRTRQIRDVMFVSLLLLIIGDILILPRCNFTEAKMAVISLFWVLVPMGILIGWSWGFAATARKEATNAGLSAGRR